MTDAPLRNRLHADLAAAIMARRDDLAADALAAELLGREADGYPFLGVTADAARAVFHQPHEWAIRSLPLGNGEVAPVYTGAFEAEFVHRPSEYVADRPAGAWAWLHPRFRWAVPTGDESS